MTRPHFRLALSFLGVILLAGLSSAADWPQFLGPTRDGVSTETGLAKSWPADGPKVLWKKSVGAGWSGPVVAGDKLILFHRIDNQEVVECLDPASGKQHWKASYRTRYRDDFGFDEGPRAAPLIAGKHVFTLGADGDLHAYDLESGKELWARNVNKDYNVRKGFFGVASSPLLAGGKLLVEVGGKGAGVVAFDPESGKELWKAGDDEVSYSSPTLAKVGGETLAVFFTRQGLLALKPDSGEVRYRHPWRPRNPNSVNAATPLISGNQIFLSTSYNTGAILLEADKGELKEVWKGDGILSNHYNTAVLQDGYLYGIEGRQEYGAKLRCVEWKTGKVRWTKEGFGCASLILVDGMVLACAEGGDVVLFEPTPEAYREKARATLLESPVRAPAALAGGRLYARDGKKLSCVELKT